MVICVRTKSLKLGSCSASREARGETWRVRSVIAGAASLAQSWTMGLARGSVTHRL